MTSRPIRVLIVDDSALVRRALADCLAPHPDIQVVGTAVDPYAARDKILRLEPDVLTLDIEMPRMDGLTFLRLLMQHRPLPVVVMSSLTSAGSAKALEALQAGAVEVLGKPAGANTAFEDGCRLAEVIRAAARARLAPAAGLAQASAVGLGTRPAGSRRYRPGRLVLLGASTGGTEALKTVLTDLPADVPGICIVQHIPAHFSLAFANRLNALCRFEVREARTGDEVRSGLALVAPGGFHMVLRRQDRGYRVTLTQGPAVHYQRPAVDVLFDSALKAGAAAESLAVLLTGMGSDGAAGMLALKRAGAETIAQDEHSCVVFGMPREAIRLGAADAVLPLSQIAHHIDQCCTRSAIAAA